MKARVLIAKYGLRNLGKENDLGWKDRVEVEEIEQRAVTRNIKEGIQNLTRPNHISKSMAIGQFLNPQRKDIDDDLKIIVNEIAKAYSTGNKTHETNEEDDVIPKIRYSEVMKILQKLRLYEEQHVNRDSE